MVSNLLNCANVEHAERHLRNCFVDFVSGLLRINPLERWTPQQARNHPFILDTEWTGPYNPLADTKYASSSAKAPDPRRRSEAKVKFEQPRYDVEQQQTRYEPPPPYDPPSQPPQVYYSPRHAPVQPPQQYLPQQSHAYIPQSYAPQLVYPAQEWDPHTRQQRVRDNRPRANTIGNIDTIPLQLRQASARIDPTHQIRPSPAYYPPHDIEGILTDDGAENSTSRNIYAMQGGYGGGVEGGMRPRKKSHGNSGSVQFHPTAVPPANPNPTQVQAPPRPPPQGQGQMLVPPQQNLFRGSARALEDGLMPPWQ